MTTLSIDAIMAAMIDYAEACSEEGEARAQYTGYSWGWHGGRYIEAVNATKDIASDVLKQYIAQEVAEQVKIALTNKD